MRSKRSGAGLDGPSFPLPMSLPECNCIVGQERCHRHCIHLRLAIHHQHTQPQVLFCFTPLTLPGVKRSSKLQEFDSVHRDSILVCSENCQGTVQQSLGFCKSVLLDVE
jgi:hypothetical protein